jgi:hypothetical protein
VFDDYNLFSVCTETPVFCSGPNIFSVVATIRTACEFIDFHISIPTAEKC